MKCDVKNTFDVSDIAADDYSILHDYPDMVILLAVVSRDEIELACRTAEGMQNIANEVRDGKIDLMVVADS